MNTNKHAQQNPTDAQDARPTWGDKYDEWHRCPPAHDPTSVYVGDMALGMFDQEDLYPHLVTEFQGARVAVPLGDAGRWGNEDYVVAEFFYQTLPQREINWGWAYPIHRVKLVKQVRAKHYFPGVIRTLKDGSLEMYCSNPRGMFEWLAIPGATTNKPAGRVYEKWEIFVRRGGDVQSMVRYDGVEFQLWAED